MADLLINGKDALIEWGVRMGDGFLDTINGYYPLKDYITNNDRLADGVQYAGIIPKANERNLTLTFTMEGVSAADFTTKNHKFIEELRKGNVIILIPEDSPNVYHLKYTGRNCTFARNTDRTFAKIGLAFIEPNPTNRT
nr:MAG TPA: tail protein [Caudoviricetes sp.]